MCEFSANGDYACSKLRINKEHFNNDNTTINENFSIMDGINFFSSMAKRNKYDNCISYCKDKDCKNLSSHYCNNKCKNNCKYH